LITAFTFGSTATLYFTVTFVRYVLPLYHRYRYVYALPVVCYQYCVTHHFYRVTHHTTAVHALCVAFTRVAAPRCRFTLRFVVTLRSPPACVTHTVDLVHVLRILRAPHAHARYAHVTRSHRSRLPLRSHRVVLPHAPRYTTHALPHTFTLCHTLIAFTLPFIFTVRCLRLPHTLLHVRL